MTPGRYLLRVLESYPPLDLKPGDIVSAEPGGFDPLVCYRALPTEWATVYAGLKAGWLCPMNPARAVEAREVLEQLATQGSDGAPGARPRLLLRK
jgi:hypothetical protein